MSYKTFLTYADAYSPNEDRMALSADLARNFDAHLTVAVLGYEPEVPPSPYPAGYDDSYPQMIADRRREVEDQAKDIAKQLDGGGVRFDAVPITSPYSLIGRRFSRLARYADLAIFDAPYETGDLRSCHEIFEATLFSTDTPALVCAPGTRTVIASTAVIAWNESREALRAVRGALPFLRKAEEIEIATVGRRGDGMAPAEDLAVMLARQGAVSNITSLSREEEPVSDLLRRRLSDLGAGLLVMGGYGHSRLREYITGGVSRDILTDLPGPVLIAH